MGPIWFLLGALVVLFVWGLRSWTVKNQIKLSWLCGIGIITAVLLGLFTIAWSVSSIVEGENRAAVMGLLFFGIFSLIIFRLVWRKLKKNIQQK
jgi:O-antigen ligase